MSSITAMNTKKNLSRQRANHQKPTYALPNEIMDQLIEQFHGKDAADLLGTDGLAGQLKKQLAERILAAELSHHLKTESEKSPTGKSPNYRNGSSKKTVLTPEGKLELSIPRDRLSSFDPQLVAKHQRRLPNFDNNIISLYAKGMSVREIQRHLLELYGLEISPDLISTITDEVLVEVEQWQKRGLEAMYPIVYFDALRLKIRDEGSVKNKAVYLALGVLADGRKEILGLWIEQSEGARFWLKVFNELKNRGLNDILIAVVDGLRGFPEAIQAVYPETQVQTCIVHLIRNSTRFASWKEKKPLADALKTIYQAVDADAAENALQSFAKSDWGKKFPTVADMWKRQWEQVIPFFAYPPAVRKIIYTTNAIESLHMQLRKVTKNRGHFPNDTAATKLLYLALRDIEKKWKMPPVMWKQAANQFAIMFGERFTIALE